MSYLVYINGNLLEMVDAKDIAITKQVNDLAKLDNRQTNFTHTFKVPKTAANIRAMQGVSLVGSQSNFPYSRFVCDVFDADNGECLIYRGWAVITGSDEKHYSIHTYDGNIDFFKTIENKTLTQVGISELNHVKNLDNVIATFDDSMPYKYIVADYNGKTLNDDLQLNIDYLVPSARVSYLWDRLFQFSGFTYSGNVFATEYFTNWYMTFPKPVPTEVPVVTAITSQTARIDVNTVEFPGIGMGGVYYGSNFIANIFPNNFDTAQANNNSSVYILIEVDGSFRLKCSGVFQTPSQTNGKINYTLRDASGLIKSSGVCDGEINESVVIQANIGDKLYLTAQLIGRITPELFEPMTGDMISTLDLIVGYTANFEEALIDFSIKEFVDEVMQRLGITMFKDKYSNNIEFLTFSELLQNDQTEDWSDKFAGKGPEKYRVGSYSQKNLFKYRYNEENQDHNDGAIYVDDVNLPDQSTEIQSKIYSPERLPSIALMALFNSDRVNIYRMWNKQVKDSGEVEYKDLEGRYYFLRSTNVDFYTPKTIVSESLNTSEQVSMLPRESFYRMKFQEIIYDFYPAIQSILGQAKTLEPYFNLSTFDVARFDFKRLIYVKQLSSYYLVNKIVNFVKGQLTKVEIIEVDFMTELDLPAISVGTFVTISDAVIDGCDVNLTFNTDQPFPAWFTISANKNVFGGIANPLTDSYIQTMQLSSGQATITLPSGGSWNIIVSIASGAIVSNVVTIDNLIACTPEPPEPNLTFLTITSIETLSIVNGQRNIKVNYDTDWNFSGAMVLNKTATSFGGFGAQTYIFPSEPSEFAIYHTVTDNVFGSTMIWNITLSVDAITSNTVAS